MSPFDFELRARCMIASCFSTDKICVMTRPSSTSLKYKAEYNWSKLQCILSITPLSGRVYIKFPVVPSVSDVTFYRMM